MKLNLAIISAVFLILIGCGGGGSSSGSQDPVPTNNTSVDIKTLVGTYRGSATIKVTADLLITTKTETYTRNMVAVVTADGKITMDFEGEVVAEGTLTSTGAFSITDSLRNAGFDCDGTMTVAGAIVGNTLRANITTSRAECDNIKGSGRGSLVGTKS
jgi:hypothetical protein